MNTMIQAAPVGQLARVLAFDDFAPGLFVAALRVQVEFMPCGMFGEMSAGSEPVLVSMMPWDQDLPAAMRIVEYCLPFVLVRKPCGRMLTLDTRRFTLVQVSEAFGGAVFAEAKLLRRKAKRKKERSKTRAKSDS